MEQGPDRIETRGTRPTALAVAALVVAFVIMLALVLTDLRADQDRQLSTYRPGAGPDPSATPASHRPVIPPKPRPIHFAPETGRFRADGLEGDLPPAWFTRQNAYITVGTGVGGCFGNECRQSMAGQHPLEDNIPWGAEFEVVNVEDSLTADDLDTTADNILSSWTLHTFLSSNATGPVITRNTSRRALTTNLPRPARMITSELHYAEPDRPSGYRHFYLLVVDGTAASNTAFVADWSDNATADVTRSIQDAINSLRVV